MSEDQMKKIIHALESKKIKYYDDEINTPELKFIKAIVPYVDFKYQKQIACMTKIFELEMLMNLYSRKQNIDNKNQKNNLEMGLINALKTYLPADYFGLIKNMLMIFYVNKNKNSKGEDYKVKNIFDHDTFNDPAFKNLTPENQELIKKFLIDIKDKSPLEAFNIILEYNKKMPQNITKEQRDDIINLLLKKMSPEKKQQFLDFYSMFINK